MVAPVVRSCTSLNSARDSERAADDDEDDEDDDEEEEEEGDEEEDETDAYSAANAFCDASPFPFPLPLPLPLPTAARSLLAAANVSRAASTLLSNCPSTSCSADRRRAAACVGEFCGRAGGGRGEEEGGRNKEMGAIDKVLRNTIFISMLLKKSNTFFRSSSKASFAGLPEAK